MKRDLYKEITDKMMAELEKGEIPWKKPWTSLCHKNLKTGHVYKGMNPFILASTGFSSPYWVTFKQCKDLGGQVKAGERSTMVVFWKFVNVKQEKDKDKQQEDEEERETETKTIPILRYFNVFNVEQTTLETPETTQNNVFSSEQCGAVVSEMPNPPAITNNAQSAYYQPQTDTVSMPYESLFDSEEKYFSTLFHELTHSTGHKERLDRINGTMLIDRGNYSQEELVAEMGAAFLDAHCGIDSRSVLENSAAYIQGWLKALKDDKTLLVKAAGRAQKAADYILGATETET